MWFSESPLPIISVSLGERELWERSRWTRVLFRLWDFESWGQEFFSAGEERAFQDRSRTRIERFLPRDLARRIEKSPRMLSQCRSIQFLKGRGAADELRKGFIAF